MDQNQIAKQMMEFNKTAFDNTFGVMVALQDQAEKLVSNVLEKTPMFPEEGKKVINEWVNTYKKGRENFKATADESYKKVADFLSNMQEGKVGKK
ncbi:MAG: hypothetical protein CVU55_09020 [Deltaproteobacteria bacterium HGW-Deltaproteobacteria-13]|jgi:polyhydroxyalkanoate synthesis regulator phasin|nr:MAG: hypothetical protein CVU55_09020 [Deltaproteobacteria bacterium HGW-Deltaproteobacteria-13]